MSNKNRLGVNTILNMVKTLVGVVFPLVTFPYVLRILLPDNIGKVNFANSFVSYFSLIASLGVSSYAIRECAIVKNDKKALEKRASEIFSINVCTTVIAYFLLLVALIFFRKLDGYRTIIVIQSTTIILTTLGTDWLNTAMEDFKYITIRFIVFQVISLVLLFAFVKTKDDYVKYVMIAVLSSSGAEISNIIYRKRFCNIRFTRKLNLKTHLRPIILLFVMILAQTIFNSADITMLVLIKGDFEVGIYSTALKVENIIAQIITSLVWVMLPRLTMYYNDDNIDKVNELLGKILAFFLVVGLPCVIGVIVLAKDIILIVGGHEYLGATLPLTILMLSLLFNLFGGSFLGNMVLLPTKREGLFMIICCICTGVNLVLNIVFIPKGGAIAAATTTTIATLLMLIILWIKKDKKIKIANLPNVVCGPAIGAGVIFVLCEYLKYLIENIYIRIGMCIFFSIGIYLGVLIISKNEFCLYILNILKKKMR